MTPPAEKLAIGTRLLAEGRIEDALPVLESAERDAPLNPEIQHALSTAYRAAGDAVKAAAAAIAAGALEARAPLPIYNIATGYFMHGQSQAAEKWYRVALALDPALAIAHQNLAAILRADGRLAEAEQHRELAYARQWIFTDAAGDPTAEPAAKVLLACTGGIGNVPFEYLLPPARFCRIKCFVDHARLEQDDALAQVPPYDLAFNAIGDADVLAPDDHRLLRVLQDRGRPILNDLQAVARTRRDRLPASLEGIDHIVAPEVWRIELPEPGAQALAAALAREGARYPLIARPAASHGGAAVVLAEDRAAIEGSSLPGDSSVIYATAYHDYRSSDGHFRKYRIIFVDRRPYPYHLAIAQDWLVHYVSAGMLEEPWKIDEERRFLDSPAQAIGETAMHAIEAIGRRIDLDYAGVDFSVLSNGSVLVFEANATMLVHPERDNGPLAHKNRYVNSIIDAFQRMIIERAVQVKQ